MTRLGRGLLAAFSAALFATGPAWAQATGMEAALASMLARHPTLAAKQSQVQARQFAIEAVGAQRYPSLQALAQQSADQGGQALVTAVTLRLRQPIWAFGRIDSAMANAEADLRVERLDLLRLQRQLIDTTASAYAKAWSAQQRLQV